MSKVRSPNYPSLTLSEAIEAMRPVFQNEHKNKMSRQVLAKHLGYTSLNGRSLTKIGAVRSYGLIDGSGDELRVSDDAVVLLNAPQSSGERAAALIRAETRPPLFAQLRSEYPTRPSEENLRYELIKSGYTAEAAGKVAKTYLANYALVSGLGETYSSPKAETQPIAGKKEAANRLIEVGDLVQVEIGGALALEKPERVRAIQEHNGDLWLFVDNHESGIQMESAILVSKAASETQEQPLPPKLPLASAAVVQPLPALPSERREVFALDEGDVVLTFPENLSAASFHDLDGYLRLFLRKAQRRASAGAYFAEVYAPDGIKAKEVRYFDDFPALKIFVDTFKQSHSSDILRVHLPSHASAVERQAMADIGAWPT